MRGRGGERTDAPRPGAFLPLVLLVLVALVVGVLNTSLVEPYTSPRVAADEHGAYVFYDTAERTNPTEHAFLLRTTLDGVHFDKAQRAEGRLEATAIASDERLVCLFPDFFSVYARLRGLEREWSGSATQEGLGFDAGHLARVKGRLFALGTTREGALRAARLESEDATRPAWRLAPLDAHLDRAAEPPGPEVAERGDDATPAIPAPAAWTSAEERDGTLAVLFRVQRGKSRAGLRVGGEPVASAVRLARFDGAAFIGSEAVTLDDDLAALCAVSVVSSATAAWGPSAFGSAAPAPTAAWGPSAFGSAAPAPSTPSTATITTEVHVFGVRRGDTEPRIIDYLLEGTRLRPVDTIAYKKGGFFEDRPAQALAAFSQPGRVVLFAQVGGAIRVIVKKDGRWGEWGDMARMPPEALALVYFYLGSLLVLGAIMIVAGLWALRKRVGHSGPRELDAETADRLVREALGPQAAAAAAPGAPRDAADSSEGGPADPSENDAPIQDRLVAFFIDCAIVVGILSVVRTSFQIDLTKLGDDPTRHFAIWAWCGVALLAYLTLCETILGRTPGKRLLGLEIKTLDGQEAPLLARIYRNAFRVELIFFATMVQVPTLGVEQRFLVPLLALIVLLGTPRAQRPGDIVAGTVVQRAPEPRRSGPAATADEEEESA